MPVDPKGRTEPGFVRHAFICGHQRPEGATRPSCLSAGSLDLIRVQKSGCLDHCEFGPTCVVYPEGVWYGLTTEESIEALFQHLVTGEVDQSQTLRLE